MSHPAQVEFVRWVKSLYHEMFHGTRVLDCGSLDINGNCRGFFEEPSHYWGIDVGEGPNVDQVCRAADFASLEPFDVVISTEMLEHSSSWPLDLINMRRLVRPRGLMVITCAGDGREEHGTTEHDAWTSPHTNDYYRNVSNEMFATALGPEEFSTYFLQQKDGDLQFFGVAT